MYNAMASTKQCKARRCEGEVGLPDDSMEGAVGQFQQLSQPQFHVALRHHWTLQLYGLPLSRADGQNAVVVLLVEVDGLHVVKYSQQMGLQRRPLTQTYMLIDILGKIRRSTFILTIATMQN